MRRYGCKISFSNLSKYDGLRGLYALTNNLLRQYLNFCEGIWALLVDYFLVGTFSTFTYAPSLLLQKKLDPLYFLLLTLQLSYNMSGFQLEHFLKVWICLSCCCQGFSLFFKLLVTQLIVTKLLQYTTTLVAEKGSFFTIALFL